MFWDLETVKNAPKFAIDSKMLTHTESGRVRGNIAYHTEFHFKLKF